MAAYFTKYVFRVRVAVAVVDELAGALTTASVLSAADASIMVWPASERAVVRWT